MDLQVRILTILVETARYIADNVKNTTVGFGDSATLESINLAELLSKDNTVIDPSTYSGAEFNEVGEKSTFD